MSEIIVVYPTSANPPTWGHADVMYRAAKKFSTLYWVAAVNPSKILEFTVEQRVRMMRAYVDYYKLSNVIVDFHQGTIVRYALNKNAHFLLRGLRNTSDFQAELELSAGNRGIDKEIETICLFAKPHFATISSKLIRELATLGERIDQYVLPQLVDEIKNTLNHR
ncbi:MAG: pantetheine-phosphate adenylyltransferase [Oligoflexia bacterium]|nr:pantetheine-phosphate adenylyltransferase [Oligoflexia bacterium]